MYQEHHLTEMSGGMAKEILRDILAELSQIPEEEMTTFELNILKNCSQTPPQRNKGVEISLSNLLLKKVFPPKNNEIKETKQ